MKPAIAAVLIFIFAGTHPAGAQSLFGTILGTVTDSSQAIVAGAKVKIRNQATNVERALTTNSDGNFEAPALPVGVYEVDCEFPGFKRAVVKNVSLQVDERQRTDIRLELGDVVQTVELTAAAGLIETDTATEGTVVDNRSVVMLPLNGRDFRQLAILGPGVSAPVTGSASYFSVGGARGLGVSYLMDGATNSNTNANTSLINPSIDLIQEFKVLRNTFNAEFGHGSAEINVVTKSGTNQIHATLFEFLRNDKIQSRNFFDTQKPGLRRNQFGGTFSGPLVIPKLYSGKNKTFFLFNYEGVRERDPSTLRATVPTQAQLGGDLSSIATPVIDPLTGLAFPGNIIPASRIDPATKNIRQFLPVTNAPLGSVGVGLNYITAVSAPVGWNQGTVKLDHNFNSNHNAFARYTITDNSSTAAALLPIYGVSSLSRQQSAVLGDNFVIHPNLINEFRFGFARHNLHNAPNGNTADLNYASVIGLKNLLSEQLPAANSLPSGAITGFTGFGGGAVITQRVNTFSYVDNLSWIRGKHSFKFGADIRRMLHDTRNIGPTQGSFSFTGAFSKVALGDFLLGIPQTATGTAPPGVDGVNLTTLWQGFVQDEWKATSKLTLSFGLRYEYMPPWINNRDRISIFDPNFPGGRLIYPADTFYFVPGQGFIPTDHPLASRGLYQPDKKDFAPRFGFAWRPFGGSSTSVRGGYGIFIDNSNETNNIMSIGNPPDLLSYAVTNDVRSTSPTPWSQLFPAPDAAALSRGITNVATMGLKMPSGYVQQWSFNIQREVGRNMAIELGYMGSKGTNLDKRQYLNQAVLDAPGKTTPIVSRLPFPAFAPGLIDGDRTAMSHYNAFLSRFERRFSSGFSFLAAYTFSKGIDNSSFSGNIGTQPAQAQNAYNEAAEKGLSYFDTPHRVVVNYIYELPFGPGKPFLSSGGVAAHVVGGWRVSGITQYQTGNPWSILTPGDVANVGTAGVQRANVVGNPFPDGFVRGGTARLAFNTAAFAIPAAGTFGNSGRNIIRDASISNTDLSLERQIRLTERARLQFRAEFFNAWNHTQFQSFGNSLGSPTFGIWNSARSPRIVQFGLKLNY